MSDAWSNTARGHAFDLLDPDPATVDVHDIADALANSCRYNGNCLRFYSVAEHSVHIANYLEAIHGPELGLAGLLHDAAEAYLGDLSWPAQQALFALAPGARIAWSDLTARIDVAIISALVDAQRPLFFPIHHHEVKLADRRILLDEKAALLRKADRDWGLGDLKPLGVEIRCWTPTAASAKWLAAYRRLVDAL